MKDDRRPVRAFPLWEGIAPGALGSDPERDVPTLEPYWPQGKWSGAMVIISPGGGYWELMSDFEGRDYALWLNERGIAAFVLKYRLASAGYFHPTVTGDLRRAVRYLRSHARSWEMDPAKIGVMGSSAGGHLSSYALTHFDAGNAEAADPVERVSSRPDFGVLCYPVISSRLDSFKNLAWPDPGEGWKEGVSSELQVRENTPPCFIWHTLGDKTVLAEHSLLFAQALQEKKIPYSLHIYPKGPHSIGLGVWGYRPGTGQELHPWTLELERWLGELGMKG